MTTPNPIQMDREAAPVGSVIQPCPFCGGKNVKPFGPYGWYRQWGISHSCKAFYSGTSEMMQGFRNEAEINAAYRVQIEQSSCVGEGGGEPVRPADVGFLKTLTDQEIEEHGRMFSSMVRAGLLQDILAELYDHRAYRNAALANPPLSPEMENNQCMASNAQNAENTGPSANGMAAVLPSMIAILEADQTFPTETVQRAYQALKDVLGDKPPLAPVGDVRKALENIANGREPSTGSPLAVTHLEDVRRYARQALAALKETPDAE